MKSFYGFLMSVALLGVFATASMVFAAPVAAEKQQVFVKFEQLVKLNDVLLRGEYVIVHDGALMEQGKPCFFVYTLDKGQAGKLVTTFHCERIARPKVEELRITFLGNTANSGVRIVREIQFAGDTEAHLIKNSQHQH